VSKLFRAG
jgi:F0F1-type ATP synthase epsilon subunit